MFYRHSHFVDKVVMQAELPHQLLELKTREYTVNYPTELTAYRYLTDHVFRLGPTSLTYILHSSSTMPAVDSFDLRYHQTWRVGRSGEGFIQIHEQDDPNMPTDDDNFEDGGKTRNIEREVLQSLINYYFRYISPIFPVITESEFLHGTSEDRERAGKTGKVDTSRTQTHEPTPVLLYAMCTIAATARHVPFQVFDALRIMLNTVIRSDDVLSTATLSNIQALLIAGMSAEAHGRVPSQAMSAAFIRTSTAIRMAQDLGLHRAEAVKTDIDLRRRLWAGCVIQDRWYALTLGLPFIIDVQDCDARLPRPEIPAHLLQHGLSPEVAREAKSLLFMGEFVRLSVLMGRMCKAVYSPTGLIHTTDETLENLQYELETFMQKAPPELILRDNESDMFAGLLHICHTAVGLVFWRVFARIQYTIPAHLKFAITVEAWTGLTVESARAIRWLEQPQNEKYYDSLMMVAYSLTSCALVQVCVSILVLPSFSPIVPLTLSICSTILGHDAVMRKRKTTCGELAIPRNAGNVKLMLATCSLDARYVQDKSLSLSLPRALGSGTIIYPC